MIRKNLPHEHSICRELDNAVVLFTDASYITKIQALRLQHTGMYRLRASGWAYQSARPVVLRMYAGQYDTAIEQIEKSLRLNPLDRMAAPLTAIGGAYFFKREFEIALAKLHASIQERPGFAMSYRLLAACHAHLGQFEQARAALERR